jgi:hypothetical protein
MQKISIISAVLLCAIMSIAPAYAVDDSERNPGDVELNIWGLSKHLESPPQGRQWNEFNPGIGVRMYFQSPIKMDGLETFFTADYMLRNSTGGRLITAGVGAQYHMASVGETKLFVGIAGGVSNYQNKWEERNYTSLAGYPFVAVRYHDITVTGGYILKAQIADMKSYPTLFFFLSTRL